MLTINSPEGYFYSIDRYLIFFMEKPLYYPLYLLFSMMLAGLTGPTLMAGNVFPEAQTYTRPDGNDNPNDAETVLIPEGFISSFVITGTVYNPSGPQSADNDWFNIPVTSNMEITASYSSSNYTIWLQIWDNAGRTAGEDWAQLENGIPVPLSSTKYYSVVVYQQGSAGNWYDYSVSLSTTPLPVVWSDLDLKAHEGGIDVLWETAQEMNNDRFEVMHSVDGDHWTALGTVAGAGNSDVAQAYEFRDTYPAPGVNHYQIKQVDYNGAYALSQVMSIELESKLLDARPFFYPNPSHGTLTIMAGYKALSLYSLVGEQVYHQTLTGGRETLTLTKVPKGLYLVIAYPSEGPTRMDRLMLK